MPPPSKLPPAETPSSDEESSDDEESSESFPPINSPLKKPPPPPSQPQHQPSSDETDDSDSEHGSPQKPQPISSQRNHPKSIPPALTKSTASKRSPDKSPEKDSKLNKKKKLLVPEVSETEKQQPKHKKNKATTAAGTGTGTVSEEHVQKKKRAASASAAATSPADPAVSEEESEKKLFQPIWSGEDQIELLKGMISLKKQGKELQYNWEEFFDSMKGKVHFDASLPQVQNKVRSLRKKFFNNFAKENKNKGHSPSFRNVLEENAYQLSKKIWGGGGGVNDNANGEERGQGKNDGNNNGDKGKSIKTSNDLMTSPKKNKEMSLLEGAGPNVDSEEKDDLDDYPCLSVLTNGGGFEFGQMLPFMQAPSKKGLIRLDSEKRKEFEGRWRKLFDRKTDLVFDELQLAKEMNKAVWDVMQDVE